MRPPDFRLGDPPHFRRWVLLDTRWLKVFLHQHLRGEHGFHDHASHNASIVLSGSFNEERPGGIVWKVKRFGSVFRHASTVHRMSIPPGGCWTLFIAGPASHHCKVKT